MNRARDLFSHAVLFNSIWICQGRRRPKKVGGLVLAEIQILKTAQKEIDDARNYFIDSLCSYSYRGFPRLAS